MKYHLILFLIAVMLSCTKNSSEISKKEDPVLPNVEKQAVSPSDVVKAFWEVSVKGDENGLERTIIRTPSSYWIQCKENINKQKPKEDGLKISSVSLTKDSYDTPKSDEELAVEQEENYLKLLKTTFRYIKVNQIKLLSFYSERVFNDEAVIFAHTGNQFGKQDMTFYLSKQEGQWKIFLIDSDNSVEPYRFLFAEQRPNCT